MNECGESTIYGNAGGKNNPARGQRGCAAPGEHKRSIFPGRGQHAGSEHCPGADKSETNPCGDVLFFRSQSVSDSSEVDYGNDYLFFRTASRAWQLPWVGVETTS